MGKLVPFEKRPAKASAPRPPQGQAEIVMFTGIRYQRDPGAPDKPPAATTGSKRKRV